MIEVEHLTKHFSGRPAVRDLSFSVGEGEVVGFLGPNGAGKTTTMRILSCYLPPTGGSASIAGLDIMRDSLEVRRRVGYMPENVPLYADMRVVEHLRFRARLKGVRGRRVTNRVDEVIGMCGLEDAADRIVGQLSKGYRQRVGLADALVHEPDVLILDEPTIGLDPNQIRHIRSLIRGFGKHYTVLLSSHILPEVETVCERVVIINDGRIVASDTTGNLLGLMKGNLHVTVEIRGPVDDVRQRLTSVPGVVRVAVSQIGLWHLYQCECVKESDAREGIFVAVREGGWVLRELTAARGNLEDVFVAMTGEEGAPS